MKNLPLKEMSIEAIYNGDKATYEIPIYQRNYAWEKDEISALIHDVYDASIALIKKTYFIGTLVSFHKGDQVYEVIDGQQRLTTINLILCALKIQRQNKLTYRARKKSNDTLESVPDFKIDEKDYGITNGYKFVENSIKEIIPERNKNEFKEFFRHNVHLIHYQVPKDIDLNHYFEIMNSRGEQLEKHEIIKARLLEKLNNDDKAKFSNLWECCSEMNVYIQQKYQEKLNDDDDKAKFSNLGESCSERNAYIQHKHQGTLIFGDSFNEFKISNFDALPPISSKQNTIVINNLINNKNINKTQGISSKIDTFQPIIDFSNFLLVVLKLSRMDEQEFKTTGFNLDDKELLNEFDKVELNENFVKNFGYTLLKSKYLLDNYIIHHSCEDDTIESNPWKLQHWQQDTKGKKGYLKNLDKENVFQHKMVQLLSMFEVSFTARL